jgi:hypothetical protein
VCGAGLAALLVAVGTGTIGLVTLGFGSADAALARLRGERLSIQARVVDVGEGQPGQTLKAVVEIVNRTAQPVCILGGSSDCSCVATHDLPVSLAPGATAGISVQVRLPGKTGFFNRKAYFWTDCPEAQRITFGLTGQIVPSAQTEVAAEK